MTKLRLFITASFSLLLISMFLFGCSGSKSMNPNATHTRDTATKSASASEKDKSDRQEIVRKDPVYVTTRVAKDSSAAAPENGKDNSQVPPVDDPLGTSSLEAHRIEASIETQPDGFVEQADSDDSAAAVDDDIWRQLDLAEEYYSLGVIANREASWEEAQYYFEKGLRILAQLDIESDSTSTPSPEAAKYSQVLNNIVADYRVALRSLGKLEEDVSADVLVERFGDLGTSLSDKVQVYKDETSPVTYDIPVVINERVKNSIVYFQTVAKEAFEKYLRRSQKYTPLMKEILKEHDMPEDLIYLSLVESGFNTNAYSWARAMGLWQFIASTGRLYGLDRDWWVDERKDPIKSTHAACKFLKDLYTKFGSWELAMAAYNGGPGRVSRTIDHQGTIDFWKLRLRRQTMDYVPLIMASAIIAKNPERYGFDVNDFEPEVVWDEVVIDRCLDLKTVAQSLDCSMDDLKDLNPELLRNYTPPNLDKYVLRIPKGTSSKFWADYKSMPSPKETSWVKHSIGRGETLSTIASKYGVSKYAIYEANNLKSSRIYAGQKLIVPVPLDREYASRVSRNNNDYVSSNSIYQVRSGDTMWDIARAFGTTVSALRETNAIGRGSRIYVGEKLRIPTSASRLPEKNEEADETPASYASSEPVTAEGTSKYKVQRGDTLWDIARRFGTTTAYLRQLNGLGRSSRIHPGMSLNVTGDGADYVDHMVRRGETLTLIARKYRTTTAKIMAQNNIDDPDQIQVGNSLRIYLK